METKLLFKCLLCCSHRIVLKKKTSPQQNHDAHPTNSCCQLKTRCSALNVLALHAPYPLSFLSYAHWKCGHQICHILYIVYKVPYIIRYKLYTSFKSINYHKNPVLNPCCLNLILMVGLARMTYFSFFFFFIKSADLLDPTISAVFS